MGELRTHKGHAPSSGAAPPSPRKAGGAGEIKRPKKITLVQPHRHKALRARLVGDLEQHGRTAGFLGLADGGGDFFDRSHLLLVDLDDQLARDETLLGGVAAFGHLGDDNALGRIAEAEFLPRVRVDRCKLEADKGAREQARPRRATISALRCGRSVMSA
jgi:hypothetical protein